MTTTWRAITAFAVLFLAATPQLARAQAPGSSSDWALRCFKEDVCIIQTGLMDRRQSKPEQGAQPRLVAQLALARNEDGALVAELRLPTGILIPKGLKAVVGGLQFRPALRTCLPMGCLASFDATRDVLNAMKKGGSFTVVFTEALSGSEISLPFSLKGFDTQLEAFMARKTKR